MVQNISNQVEKKINNIQKNNDYDNKPSRKAQPAPPKYNAPPKSYGGGGGHGGYGGGGRVNPMNLINDAINNLVGLNNIFVVSI